MFHYDEHWFFIVEHTRTHTFFLFIHILNMIKIICIKK